MVAIETSTGEKGECNNIDKSQHFLRTFHVLGMILGVLQVIAFLIFATLLMKKLKSAGVINLAEITELVKFDCGYSGIQIWALIEHAVRLTT